MVIFRKVYISRVRKYVIALRHLHLSLSIHGNAEQPHHFWGFQESKHILSARNSLCSDLIVPYLI